MVVLQAGPGPVAVLGTYLSLAFFLSLTAHLAARNVLGDVSIKQGFVVGPWPATVAFVFTALSWPVVVAVPLALLIDGLVIDRVYEGDRRLTVYITLIHAVVSVLLGAILVGTFFLLRSAPG